MAAEPSRALRGRALRLPRALPEPATIGVCAPSGRVDEATLTHGVAYLEDLGHRVVIAPETLHTWRYFAGTDEERLQGFHAMPQILEVRHALRQRGLIHAARRRAHADGRGFGHRARQAQRMRAQRARKLSRHGSPRTR